MFRVTQTGVRKVQKYFISAQELLQTSFRLAHQVYTDGYRPDFIVGVWRGGTPVGIAVQEYFEYHGIEADHIAVRTCSYSAIDCQSADIRIDGLEYLLAHAGRDDSVLIVDDVFDSGRSADALVAEIERRSKPQAPREIRVACAWYKPGRRKVEWEPDYAVHRRDDWLVFPHELCGLAAEEIRQSKTDLTEISDLFTPR
jgi:hypoxanthine phosphoribosyltransferase